ncbi:hypothetical protein P22_2195 [Propionispora sp. 2/2-37]|nr:hypothetical protein P22_2195 [Propionispora sp. 2/2-37]
MILPENLNVDECHSRIEDITEEYMVIAMPMTKGYPVIIPNGSVVLGRVVSKGQVYQFESRVLGKRISPLPVWLLTLPTNIVKVQQRSFVRLDIVLPAKMQVLTPDNETDEASLSDNRVFTKNISGGGLCLITGEPVDIGTQLQMEVEIPEQEVLRVIGRVARVEKPQNDRQLFWIGVEFLDVSESIRSRIIRFVFKKQLEQRQKQI